MERADQVFIEMLAKTLTEIIQHQVDGGFPSEAVGGTALSACCIGIAQNQTIVFQYKPWPRVIGQSDMLGHISCGHHLCLKGYRGVFDILIEYIGDTRTIIQRSFAYCRHTSNAGRSEES